MPERWDLGAGYLKTPFVIEQGYIAIPEEPGLGIELDEETVAARSYPGNWDTPRLYHEDDGAVADW